MLIDLTVSLDFQEAQINLQIFDIVINYRERYTY